MNAHHIILQGTFHLETGDILENIEITYHTMGTLTADSKVVWICHALTANSDAEEWWPGMVGEGKFFNGQDYFIVCANVIGSCYGTTGPLSVNPRTRNPYFGDFPCVTVRDMVAAHNKLREYLGINKIYAVIGSSIGGFQAIEYAMLIPDRIERLVLIATNCRVTPWGTAFNEAQRMSIFADRTYFDNTPEGGLEGMKAARAAALLSYRSYDGYNKTQYEENEDIIFAERAASYEKYQGKKLADRFNAYSYVIMTKAFDSHNTGRLRGGIEKALASLKVKTLLTGIDSDILFPVTELKFMHRNIPDSQYAELSSVFGHDGFLLESEQLSAIIHDFFSLPAQPAQLDH
ncbi:MAG: homoserine O-acetyltransferase [Prevotellaceae bacterium]|jgi:homoserine O-acetyltransferase|nr:homoserine O-acetyltransferase [Prevotellaceae bacterium]